MDMRLLTVVLLVASSVRAGDVEKPTVPDPDAIASDLAGATLAVDAAVDAAGLALALDHARLELTAGRLIPVRVAGADAPFEWVFVGRGRLSGEPPTTVEAEQLEYFTGSRSIDAAVHRAVILPGERWDGAKPRERGTVELDAATRDAAQGLFREWTEEAEREGFGARTALVRALAGDPVGRAFAGAWIDSPSLGRTYYAVDPASREPSSFGAFRLYELRDLLTRRLRKSEDRAKRIEAKLRERIGTVQAEEETSECGRRDERPDLDQDYVRFAKGESAMPWIRPWISAPARGADPGAEPAGFEPQHYAIELELEGEDLEARGVARIRLRSNAPSLRVVPLLLVVGMDVCEVEDGLGRQLPFHEDDWDVLVALAEPTVAGESMELVVRFAGSPVTRSFGRRGLRDTIHWHPHVGHLDRATYDVTLRWPASLTLLASGSPVDGGTDGDERWTRRVLDVPTIGFSFEIDDYDVVEDHAGHVDFTFGFFRGDREMTAERRAEIVTAVKASLLFFEAQLGHLPIDRLTVVMTDRNFSQGLLGFQTLTHGHLHATPFHLYDDRTGQEVRLEVIAHEMAHQWWGHAVGWDSYRDQWLSEALATFSAARFMTAIAARPSEYLENNARRLRNVLSRQTKGGQPIASTGSVLLGWRLSQNYGPGVYHAVVYERGAAVFTTLAQQLGVEPTWQMLGELARAVSHRVIRTDTFFRAFERMSGRDLDAFVEQYVHGVGMPALFYEYAPRQAEDGSWLVEGTIRQLPPARFRYAVVPTEIGWDVIRRFGPELDVSRWEIAVPFVADTSSDGETSGIEGQVTIRGARSAFSIPVPRQPRTFALDPHGFVLATTHGSLSGSGGSALAVGEHLLRLGRHAEAADALRQAIEIASRAEAGRDQIVLSRLALARLHIDLGQLDSARAELRAIDKLLPADSDFYLGERVVVAARLALRTGDHALARNLLNDFVAEHAAELEDIDAHALLDPDRVTALRFARGEMAALLAVAERTGGGTDSDLVIRMADMAGVDMKAFGSR
jgi:hypothetical protein